MPKQRRFFYVAVIFIMIFLFASCSSANNQSQTPDSRYIPVEVTTVAVGSIKNILSLSGLTEPQDYHMVISAIPGVVADLHVVVGDYVSEGDTLFTLKSDSIEQKLSQAEAALNSAYAHYEAVSQRAVIAQKTLSDAKNLYQNKKITLEEYQQAEELASDKTLAEANQLLLQAQSAFVQAEKAYRATVVKAPASGLVSVLNLKKGGPVTNTEPALLIADTAELLVRIDVSENYINRIKTDDTVDISVPAANYTTTGKVISVSPVKDRISLLYPVKIRITNERNIVKASMFAEARITVEEVQDKLIIPYDAVVTKNNQLIVYVVTDNQVDQRQIVTGLDNGVDIEVKQGLSAGETVVIAGQHYLAADSTVKIVRGE